MSSYLNLFRHSSNSFYCYSYFDLEQFNADADMHEEVRRSVDENATLEERSNFIQLVSVPSSCEDDKPTSDDHDEVEEPSIVHNIKTEKNSGLFLSDKLDKKGFCEGFAYIWGQWTTRSDIGLSGFGWIFKLFLWCLR